MVIALSLKLKGTLTMHRVRLFSLNCGEQTTRPPLRGGGPISGALRSGIWVQKTTRISNLQTALTGPQVT